MGIKPKLSVTGYRGIWGESLDEHIAFEYVRSYARMIKEEAKGKDNMKVLIGRDARQSGPMIYQAAKQAFEQENIEVTYAGMLPTPSMLLLVKKLVFDGGIMITASHNPPEYNGIKFIMPRGMLTNEVEVEKMETFRHDLTEDDKILGITVSSNEELVDNKEFRKMHIDTVLNNIDADLIRSRKFTVCLDPINSAGSIITQELLKELGCIVHVINGEQTGDFAHMPEPLAQNLAGTEAFVKEVKPDIGFVQDPDADRLVLINEKGEMILEELMVSLAIKSVLSRETKNENGKKYMGKRTIVTNLSTTRVCDNVAREYGSNIIRTKVGEANLVEEMLRTEAIVGGEGSGGLIYPPVGLFRDSLCGIGLILELLARENKKISEIVFALPRYYMKKDKIPVTDDPRIIYEKIKKRFPEAKANELDGVRLDWPDASWLHTRASITEPIIRIFGEATTEKRIDEIFAAVRLTLSDN